MAPSFGSILPSRRPRAPNITIDESALEQGTVSSDANTTDPASNLDSVAIHQIDTNADNLVSDDMPMQALDAMKDDQLHLRVPKLFSHDNSSVSSFASVVQNPRLGMPRQTQRTWAMDCLNNNLEAVFGNDQKIPKTYGLSAEEQEQKLVEVANEKYQTRDYSFYRFERLTLMNVLHWQHKLIQHDDKLSDGTISSDSEVVWTDDTALAVLQDTLAYHEALRFLHFSINQFRQPPEGRTRETGQSLARKLEEPRYWDSPDALNLMDLRPAKSEERSGPDNLRVLLQKLAPDWILDEAGKERKKLDRKKDSRYMSAGTLKLLASHRFHPRQISPSVDFLARIITSLIGGLFLIIPIVVLSVLSNSRKWSLVATSLFVVFFAISLAIATKANNQELMAATAAYAAVLVVFVGVGQQGSSN